MMLDQIKKMFVFVWTVIFACVVACGCVALVKKENTENVKVRILLPPKKDPDFYWLFFLQRGGELVDMDGYTYSPEAIQAILKRGMKRGSQSALKVIGQISISRLGATKQVMLPQLIC